MATTSILRRQSHTTNSVLALLAMSCLVGCGMSPSAPVASTAALRGTVHGGQQPVAHATVTLYTPGTIGYGSAPNPGVQTTTDAAGNFTLPAHSCAPGAIEYVTATGGDSGYGTNPLIYLVEFLGPCDKLSASSSIEINEVTTVVAAYTLAPFSDVTGVSTSIGSSSSNALGIANAFGPASNLVDLSSGIANGSTSIPGMVLPTAEINTLADILAACVNTNGALTMTTGTVTSAAPCGTLITNATPPADIGPLFGYPPNDTFQAALEIALNPGHNVANLFALSSPQAPFQPTLTTAPGDFALAIQYNGGQIGGGGFTSGLAIDAAGNAWVGNARGSNPKSISEISPSGVFLSGANGYTNGTAGGNGFSIDSAGHVWVNVAGINSILELSPTDGSVLNTFTPASLNLPTGIAVNNRDGSIWSADSDNQPGDSPTGGSDFEGTTVTHATSVGVDATGSPYGGQNGPFGVEIDGLGNTWVANSAANTTGNGVGYVTKFTPPATAGNAFTAQNIQTGSFSYPLEVGFDSANNAYVTLANSVEKFSNAGTLLSTLTAAANTEPTAVMVDGLGRVFVSNATATDFSAPGTLTVFDSSGTLLSTANSNQGYLAGNTIPGEPFAPTGLGIDGSGNVWISGIAADPNAPYQFVTEIIGIAAPITTPTTVQSSNNTYGVRP
jgi:hypothetical protein